MAKMDEQTITDAIQRQWPDRVSALKELVTQRMDFMELLGAERRSGIKLAQELQAKELERRLEILNGEAGRLRDMQSTYLPREVYGQNHAEMTKAIRALTEGAAQQRGRGQVISIVAATLVSIFIGLLTVAATYALRP